MKVLLIWPNNPNTVLSNELSCCEPLSLEYIAGTLSPYYEVTIWDLRLDPPLDTLALTYRPDVVGIAVPFTIAVPYALAISRQVQKLWPDAITVLGGHHPTVSDMGIKQFPVDYIITGEGGNRFLQLLKEIEKNPAGAKNKEIRFLRDTTTTSFDDIVKPNRQLLARHHKKYFHSIYKPVALIRFSAGCPYNCSFCILWKLTNRKYITKNIDRIIEEIHEIYSENLYVVDDEAFIQSKRMCELALEIGKQRIQKKYHMYLRADTAIRNQKLIEKWIDIGLDSVLVGAESLSDEDLTAYSKKAKVTDTLKAIDFFRKNDVKVRANFIIKPDFDESDFKKLEETVVKLKIDLPSFAVLTPLPGTDIYLKNKNELISENPELFDCYHTLFPTKLPLEKFYESFASLLINTSKSKNVAGETEAPMFYFSDNDSFAKMVTKVKNGHLYH